MVCSWRRRVFPVELYLAQVERVALLGLSQGYGRRKTREVGVTEDGLNCQRDEIMGRVNYC